MRRTTTRKQVTVTLATFKAAVLGTLLVLAVSAGVADPAAPEPSPPTLATDFSGQDVHAKLREHRCSTTGFAPDVQPSSALVRNPRGKLEVVSFDEGWEVFTGDRPGLLVAVCLDERPAR